jgi:hypothetical protein
LRSSGHAAHSLSPAPPFRFTGACYRDLREESALVSRHALALLHAFLRSLRRAHRDPDHADRTASAAAKAAAATRHLGKIVVRSVVKGDIPRLLSDVPARVAGADVAHVRALVAWLWEHVGAPEDAFRHEVWRCFLLLTPLVVDEGGAIEGRLVDDGPARYVAARVAERGVAEVVRVFEGATVTS